MIIVLSLTQMSCISSVYAQDDMYPIEEADVVRSNVNIELVIRYGTPYIVDGLVQYYLYEGLYYYPYYLRDYFYYRVYRAPLYYYPRYWRPVPRAYWFRNGNFYRPQRYDRHHFNSVRHQPNHSGFNDRRPHVDHRPSSTRNTPHEGINAPRPMERSRAIQSRPVERSRSIQAQPIERSKTMQQSRPVERSRNISTTPSQMRQAPVRQRQISTPSPMPRQAPVSRSTAPSRSISIPSGSAAPARSVGGGHFGGHR